MTHSRDLRLDRRHFIRLGTGGLALATLGCGGEPAVAAAADTATASDASGSDASTGDTAAPLPFDLSGVPEDTALFPLPIAAGPVAGGLTVVCSSAPATSRWLVWPEGGDASSVVELPPFDVDPASGDTRGLRKGASRPEGWAKRTVSSLAPGVRHFVALVHGPEGAPTARSRITTARVPHAEGETPTITLSATACTKYWYVPYDALTLATERPYDAFLHLGDMSYNDDAVSLEQYREAWAKTLADPGYVSILGAGVFLNTWDDHEIANGEWTELPAEHVKNGRDAFYEATPAVPDAQGRFWRSVRWGHTVEVFVLDVRGERDPASRETPNAQFVSPAQLEWLLRALAESPCRFKLIMTSVPVARFPEVWPVKDVWDGYTAQREALLSAIVGRVRGVIFVGGDYHFGSVHRVEREGPRKDHWEILAGPGAASPNPLVGLVEVSPELTETYVPKAQFEYANTQSAATELVFDPAAGTVQVRFTALESREVVFETVLTPD